MIPDIEIDHWDLEKLSLKESELSFTVSVHNHNNFSFQFKNVNYFFQIEEEVWTEGTLPEATHIPANGSAQLTIPLQLNIDQVFRSLGELIQKRKESSFTFNLEGQLISDNNMINDSKFLTTKEGKLKEIIELSKQK